MSELWSCDDKLASCRNPFGCHCREIIALHHQVKQLERSNGIALTALRRISSLAEKNVPKYAQEIAGHGVTRLVG
jgi:hypothetical protein